MAINNSMSIKISELPSVTLPYNGSELIPFVDNGVTSQGSLNTLTVYLSNQLVANSPNWNNTYTSYVANSANWQNTYTSYGASSANWQNTYTSYVANSPNWNNTYTSYVANSANWQNTYTSYGASSANWQGIYNTLSPTPSAWLCTNLGSLSCGINISNPEYTDFPEDANKITITGMGGSIITHGEQGSIITTGLTSDVITTGDASEIFTVGNNSKMSTRGNNSPIYTLGSNSHVLAASLSSSIGIGLGSTENVPNVPPSHIALDIKKDTIRVQGQKSPTGGQTATVGEICFDDDAMYYYVGTPIPTWKRIPWQALL